jgi:hypothetical protein
MWRFDAYSAKSKTIETIVRSLYCNTNNLIYNQAQFKQPSKHGGVCLLACKFIERRLACLNKQATKHAFLLPSMACSALISLSSSDSQRTFEVILILDVDVCLSGVLSFLLRSFGCVLELSLLCYIADHFCFSLSCMAADGS